MIPRIVPAVVAAACLFVPSLTRAQVMDFGAQKTEFYTEGADDSASFTGTSIFFFTDTTNASDATDFVFSSDTGTATSLSVSPGNPGQFAGSNFYTNTTDLDAAYPPGSNYVFTASGGTLDGQSDMLAVPAVDNFLSPLVLTNGTYLAAQNLDASQSFDFMYTPLGGGANTGSTDVLLTLTDPSGDSLSFNGSSGNIFIGAGVLTPGTTYDALLANFNLTDGSATGDFAGANTTNGFVTSTLFSVSTAAPEPGTYALMATGGLLLLALRRRAARA